MNDIEIVQGDSRTITFIVKADGVKVNIVTGDTVYFSVKKSLSQEEYDIQKVITTFINGEAIINLTKTDTNIEIGTYNYDIQWSKANNEVFTPIQGKFKVISGVTE